MGIEILYPWIETVYTQRVQDLYPRPSLEAADRASFTGDMPEQTMEWRDDLVVAARQLRRSPGWMTGVVLTLALGIGLATAVFSIAHALLLRPLPVRAQNRIVVLWGVTPDGRTDHFPLLFGDAQKFARRTRTLSHAEFFSYGGAMPMNAERGGAIISVRRSMVSGGYFDLLGTPVRQVRAVALPFADDMVGDVRPAVLAFAAAAGLLLLITCINVANLLLVRGLQRVRELAVRAALGAGRLRLVAQLLTESLLLASLGGIIGAAFAAAAVRGFIAFAPAGTPRLDELRVDNSIMLGAMLTTMLATLLFAVSPALVASRVELQELLRGGTRQTGGRGIRRATELLVAGQVALALVVLTAAALVGRSLIALEHIDLAFDPTRLVVAELALPAAVIADPQKTTALGDELTRRLQALPGIRSVTPVLTPPFAHVGGVFGQIAAEGQSADETARNPTVTYEVATPS